MRLAPLLFLLAGACASSMAPVPEERAPVAPLPSARAAPAATAAPARAPSDARADRDLLDDAQRASEHGDKARARAALVELVKQWPSSSYLPDAYVALGDLSFETGDVAGLKEAEQEYLEALKFPPPANRVYGYASYKLAFVYWNRGEGAQALVAFKRTVDHGARYPQDAAAARLRTAALHDMVPVFAQVGSPARAYPFFRAMAGDDPGAIAMLEQLAKVYSSAGKLPEARGVYQDLVVRDAPHACVHGVHARFSVPGASQAAEDAELQKCP
jgi:tetratricopeptide (TPR) repeat protein